MKCLADQDSPVVVCETVRSGVSLPFYDLMRTKRKSKVARLRRAVLSGKSANNGLLA